MAHDEITPQQVKQKLDRGESFLLLDCRESAEWQIARIEGATHMPMAQIPARLSELDPQQEVIVYCHLGGRSRSVTDFLQHQGFAQARNMTGGIHAWSRQVDPAIPTY